MSLANKRAIATRGGLRSGRGPAAGDPGLFGFLGSAAKRVLGAGVGFATGGVGGAIAGSGVLSGRGARPIAMPGGIPAWRPGESSALSQARFQASKKGPGAFTVDPGAFLPGGRPLVSMASSANGVVPRGYRLNKTGYFLKDGTYVEPGTRIVKNRRRNPLNPRALSHAMSRLTSAKKAAKVLGRISIRKSC